MKQKTIIRLLGLGLSIVLAVGLFNIVHTQVEYAGETSAQKEAAKLVNLPSQFPELPSEQVPEDGPVEALDPNLLLLAELDLDSLRAENSDVVGWICIPDTELSYPLVKGTNNSYYLNHTWQGRRNAGGSIFMEQTSSTDFTDYHTIIYGHRMNNDSMFGTLKYYSGLEFWQAHPSVYVATADGVYRYDIFSAQEAGVKEILYRLDIEEKHLEAEFLQYCIDGSAIDTGLTPKADERILTLSTCTERGRATRWVVHGVLTQAYERP